MSFLFFGVFFKEKKESYWKMTLATYQYVKHTTKLTNTVKAHNPPPSKKHSYSLAVLACPHPTTETGLDWAWVVLHLLLYCGEANSWVETAVHWHLKRNGWQLNVWGKQDIPTQHAGCNSELKLQKSMW